MAPYHIPITITTNTEKFGVISSTHSFLATSYQSQPPAVQGQTEKNQEDRSGPGLSTPTHRQLGHVTPYSYTFPPFQLSLRYKVYVGLEDFILCTNTPTCSVATKAKTNQFFSPQLLKQQQQKTPFDI